MEKRLFKYNYNDDRVEEKKYGPDDALLENRLFEYDENGNVIEEKQYGAGGALKKRWSHRYRYDAKGNMIYHVKYEDGEPVSIIEREIEYDD
ncbi:MAG: hypothetical protein U5N26_07230 [Candidatus Marinimicrobia bacterium]|nr:hypothetical protein [Candidatus Neomarinimicrobiota bacterium]